MVGIVSSLKLQKSTVKLQFGFIVSNVSPLFHLASDNKGSKLPKNCSDPYQQIIPVNGLEQPPIDVIE